MSDIVTAILEINPDAAGKVSVSGEDYNKITYGEGITPIAKSVIQAKQAELQAAYDAKEYQRKRVEEYPSMADQLDDIYHNGIDAWKATIKVTKDKYPKE